MSVPTETGEPTPAACFMPDDEPSGDAASLALTKVIATVGPATSGEETILALVGAGASILRVNLSHGGTEEHTARVAAIRAAERTAGRPLAILADLPGPKIRVGEVQEGGIAVGTGDDVIFQRDPIVATADRRPVRFASRYEHLVDDVRAGQRLLINDGAVRLLIVETSGSTITCTVTHGGVISSGKGINLPDTELSVPAMRDRDWELVRWAVAHDLDWLAMSFVSTGDELRDLARGIEREAAARGRPGWRLPVVAKIERPAAVDNIEQITEAADAIMVARGDLGVEMDLARVPVIQSRLIRVARDYGKPCIVATQMLESMIERPQPTRAEASDVAHAIFDEIDAVMLSGETAVGRYPAVAVETMQRIARHSERHVAATLSPPPPARKLRQALDPQAALAHGVRVVAEGCGASGIVVWSQSGTSARFLSQTRLRMPILAVSSDHRVVRQMQMLRGVAPMHMEIPDNLARFTQMIDEHLLTSGRTRRGERIIIVAGWPIAADMVTNTLAIHKVGDPDTGYAWHR